MAGARARLEVLTGKAAGMSIVLDDELVIGRQAEGAGRLADDEEISRSHARLAVDAQGLCTVEDLGSTNGTWVNGMRIATPQSLSEGDTLELGATTMVVREISRPEEEQPAAVEPAPAAPMPVPAAAASETDAGELPTETVPEGPRPEAPAPVLAPSEAAALEAAALEAAPREATPPEAPGEGAPTDAAARVPSTLSMKLDIDFDGPEIQILLDGATEPLRLVFDGDSWRPAPSLSTEKGNPG